MSRQNNYEIKSKGLRATGLFGRLFIYLFFGFLIGGVYIFVLGLSSRHNTIGLTGDAELNGLIGIAIVTVPVIILELGVYFFRKKHKLSLWRNVSSDLEQMAVDERVAREKKAYAKIDKYNIGYWHDLKEKGAISESEFEAKKKELL